MGGGSESESLLSACVHVPEAVRDGSVVAQSGGGEGRDIWEKICVASEKHRNIYAIGEKIWKIISTKEGSKSTF